MAENAQNGRMTQFDNGLSVQQVVNGDKLTLTIGIQNNADYILHWGLSLRPGGAWSRPPEECWPRGTTATDGAAVRTPFTANGDDRKEVTIHLNAASAWRDLAFVVYSPKENRWIKSGGHDFLVPLSRQRGLDPEEALTGMDTRGGCRATDISTRRR